MEIKLRHLRRQTNILDWSFHLWGQCIVMLESVSCLLLFADGLSKCLTYWSIMFSCSCVKRTSAFVRLQKINPMESSSTFPWWSLFGAGAMLKHATTIPLLFVRSSSNDVDKHECTTQANKQWPMEFLRSLFSVTCLASLCRPLPWQQEETTDGWSTTGHLNLGPIALAYQMNCFPLPQLKLKRQMNCCTN